MEKRFIETIDYTELSTINDNTFSKNYALLMQAIGAELDSVFKLYCGFNPTDRKSISDYVTAIDAEEGSPTALKHIIEHQFRDQVIYLLEFNRTIQPYKDWDAAKPAQSLPWWDAYNKIKHNRLCNRTLANQKNALNMLGGLFLLEMKFLKKITEGTEEWDVFDNGSGLFTLKEWSTKVVPLSNAFGVLGEMMDNDEYKPKAADV